MNNIDIYKFILIDGCTDDIILLWIPRAITKKGRERITPGFSWAWNLDEQLSEMSLRKGKTRMCLHKPHSETSSDTAKQKQYICSYKKHTNKVGGFFLGRSDCLIRFIDNLKIPAENALCSYVTLMVNGGWLYCIRLEGDPRFQEASRVLGIM